MANKKSREERNVPSSQLLIEKLLIGLEPMTPSLRVKCTTNCAIEAYEAIIRE